MVIKLVKFGVEIETHTFNITHFTVTILTNNKNYVNIIIKLNPREIGLSKIKYIRRNIKYFKIIYYSICESQLHTTKIKHVYKYKVKIML